MKLAFIGIGKVGFALANNFQKSGHTIAVAHNDVKSESVQVALAKNPAFVALPLQAAVDQAEVVFLATPFKINQSILEGLNLQGKLLVDCTNPVGPGISHGLNSAMSGAEKVADWAPSAQVVKAYTIYGFENLENPIFPSKEVKPVMLVAGDHAEGKALVQSLNTDLGFDTLDVGPLSQSLHLEHMTLLWVKMVRQNGHHPNFTWAYLER
ncbi:MAG: NADPH-dependent F420 reductase [Salibacteraceae bacterium]